MNDDIRISTSIMNSHKVTKLVRRCGADGFMSLVALWTYTATDHPDGDLSCLDVDDIEIVARWNGEPTAFYAALVDVGFLDVDGEEKTVHDWAEHNPYVVGATERKINAKIGAVCRWAKSRLSGSLYSGFVAYVKEIATVDMSIKYDQLLMSYKSFAGSSAPAPEPVPKPEPKLIPATVPTKSLNTPPPTSGDDPSKAWQDVTGGLGISFPDYSSLTSYLTSKGVFAVGKIEGLVSEFKEAQVKFGLSVANCIECMMSHGWRGFKAEWVKTSAYYRQHQANKANEMWANEARKTQQLLARQAKPEKKSKARWLLDETAMLLMEDKITVRERAEIMAGKLDISKFVARAGLGVPVGVVA